MHDGYRLAAAVAVDGIWLRPRSRVRSCRREAEEWG